MDSLLADARWLSERCACFSYQHVANSLFNIVRRSGIGQTFSHGEDAMYTRICVIEVLDLAEAFSTITLYLHQHFPYDEEIVGTPAHEIEVYIRASLAVHFFGEMLFHCYFQLRDRGATNSGTLESLREFHADLTKRSNSSMRFLFNRYPVSCHTPPSSNYDYFHRFHYEHWLDVERGRACQHPSIHRPPKYEKLWNKIPLLIQEEKLSPEGIEFYCGLCCSTFNTRDNCVILADCDCNYCVKCFELFNEGIYLARDESLFTCKVCSTAVTAWTTYYHCQDYMQETNRSYASAEDSHHECSHHECSHHECSHHECSHHEYSDDECSDDECSDDECSDDKCSDDKYSDDKYSDDKYSDDKYSDDKYSDNEYSDNVSQKDIYFSSSLSKFFIRICSQVINLARNLI